MSIHYFYQCIVTSGSYVDSDARGFPNRSLIRSGHYLARIEDQELGINAEDCGNEMRFINSYLNIANSPNCTMKTTYINKLPRIIIVCIKGISAGEEILLDYGEAYNQRYLKPKSYQSELISSESLFEQLPLAAEDCEDLSNC